MSRSKIEPIKKLGDIALEKGLPAAVDTEKLILGSILLDGSRFGSVADVLTHDDLTLEAHRRIFQRMMDLSERGEKIDRVTVANELRRYNELESIGGLTYLISLDDGMPRLPNLDSYIKIVQDKSVLRRMAFASQHMMSRSLLAEEPPDVILDSFTKRIEELRTGITVKALRIEDLPAVDDDDEEIRYVREPELPEGSVIALTGDSGGGKSTLASAWARDAIETGRPVLILDRESPRSVAKNRMRRLGLKSGPLLRWYGGWMGEVPGPDSAMVMNWVRACELKPLIIIDSLVRFMPGDENSATDMCRFMEHLRRLADLGASVIAIHHDGKSETARDFRGSSDFKAAMDQAFHVSNIGPTQLLDKLRLRCFKSRYGFTGELVYRYADGAMVRDTGPFTQARTNAEVLRDLLRRNPGVTGDEFEKKAAAAGIARSRAREFLSDGVLEGSVERTTGRHNVQRHHLTGAENE